MDPPRPSIDGSLSRPTSTSVPMTPIGGTLLSRPKIDPYYLITNVSSLASSMHYQ